MDGILNLPSKATKASTNGEGIIICGHVYMCIYTSFNLLCSKLLSSKQASTRAGIKAH